MLHGQEYAGGTLGKSDNLHTPYCPYFSSSDMQIFQHNFQDAVGRSAGLCVTIWKVCKHPHPLVGSKVGHLQVQGSPLAGELRMEEVCCALTCCISGFHSPQQPRQGHTKHPSLRKVAKSQVEK